MKTIKKLPNINDIAFCGRLISDPQFSANGNRAILRLIRNLGGEKAPIIMTFVMFKPKNGFPGFLKKGAPIIAHAYATTTSWTDKEGVEHTEGQKVIKKIELAELVEVKIDDNAEEAEADANPDEDVDIQEN